MRPQDILRIHHHKNLERKANALLDPSNSDLIPVNRVCHRIQPRGLQKAPFYLRPSERTNQPSNL